MKVDEEDDCGAIVILRVSRNYATVRLLPKILVALPSGTMFMTVDGAYVNASFGSLNQLLVILVISCSPYHTSNAFGSGFLER
ncbi:hypothetical protein POJ06DRAFT_263778 [Lipomyces tetrasporus]|uniref:Uncharacterized protein n=1 Tax=Lipomyces tetrasporus TaxID=54092 RepID=A0AAD7QL40_9ASCO|nr:uncharacterized protein POJ06DRAFT_263778 [Lipomyces tetrasporus]KAJ8096930.1 hypothetical protein POJ06DRAFT_263778 [Lipomyces tetrasporus]